MYNSNEKVFVVRWIAPSIQFLRLYMLEIEIDPQFLLLHYSPFNTQNQKVLLMLQNKPFPDNHEGLLFIYLHVRLSFFLAWKSS